MVLGSFFSPLSASRKPMSRADGDSSPIQSNPVSAPKSRYIRLLLVPAAAHNGICIAQPISVVLLSQKQEQICLIRFRFFLAYGAAS